ncbi:MAG: heavy metal translocating P-type ATPase metal-binding domain-containing protein [Saprospiraceae bacterium]|nr:heavy metal translocating P-type ATPase metal-binding domain-containing protein [Saprospiraceae bacterium]
MATLASSPTPSAKVPQNVLECYHCHDVCPDDRLQFDDKVFCCEGCQMVYQILNSNDLCQYYTIDDRAGNTLKHRRDSRAYAWLDDKEVADKLLRYADEHTARVEFYLPGMHCASCIWLLEHLYRLDAGVQRSTVNFLKKQVVIHFAPHQTSLRRLAALLDSLGYPPEINLSDVDGATPQVVDKALYYKIGLAGFAFGNIMLLSFPEYLGLDKEREAWFFGIFGYLNLIIGLPVLLYSARDYFTSAWQGIRQRHLNLDVPLALGMAVLYGRSAWEILTGTGAGFMDSFAGLLFFLLVGKWFQQKTFYHLSFERDYRSYFPVAATIRKSGGEETTVPVQKLEPGDILLIRNEELIPADGILLKGEARIDYAFVTGEAEPVPVASGERVFAGGKQRGGAIEISLTRKVSQSYLTQLWNDETFKTPHNGHASKLADRAGRYFTRLILGLSAVAILYWWGYRHDMHTAINAATAILIVACPCAVALSIPFTLANVLRILGRNRFYVKNTQVLEAFPAADAVVLDKTGTLTRVNQGQVVFTHVPKGTPLSVHEKILVKSLASQSAHPKSRQIVQSWPDVPVYEVTAFEELTGGGIRGQVGEVLVRLGSRQYIGVDTHLKGEGVFLEIDGTLRGYFFSGNQLREGLQGLMDFFHLKGNKTFLLSGDNDRAADTMATYFPADGSMQFNQSPQDKLNFVKKLREEGQTVLMLGDGLNDAGALRQSNVGIVVTENTNNFTPACDAILHADEFSRLPQFLSLAKAGVRVVNYSFFIASAYNFVGLSFAISGTLSPVIAAILMPVSSVTIILFGTLGSTLAARRLGIE